MVKVKRATKTEESPDDIEFEDSQEDEFEEEDVVQRDDSDEEGGEEGGDGWEDCSDQEMAEKTEGKDSKKQQVWDDKTDPLKEDEELEYDGSAYQMLHRSQVEWPCLSMDFLLRERSCPDGVYNAKQWFPSCVNG